MNELTLACVHCKQEVYVKLLALAYYTGNGAAGTCICIVRSGTVRMCR